MEEELLLVDAATLSPLPTAPGPVTPHLVQSPRFRRVRELFGLTAAEQLTCAFHVHVTVGSREEGVAVLDRDGYDCRCYWR